MKKKGALLGIALLLLTACSGPALPWKNVAEIDKEEIAFSSAIVCPQGMGLRADLEKNGKRYAVFYLKRKLIVAELADKAGDPPKYIHFGTVNENGDINILKSEPFDAKKHGSGACKSGWFDDPDAPKA